MAKVGIFIANGCEEIEALTVVDILRRANIEIDMISISEALNVRGSHGIEFVCDRTKDEADFSEYAGLVLPGGLPGTTNLGADETVVSKIKAFASEGKLVAAICAAPTVLGDNGLLEGKLATCYPGLEERLVGATLTKDKVAVDGNIITSRGMGTAIPFALALVEYFEDADAAKKIGEGIVYL
ncbi:MAG: DJ-1/PfpI family protein [Lachnospiraceae bacterium]|nr:DJ-1/PfpI family protein [Lachnospiraceae bacterium]